MTEQAKNILLSAVTEIETIYNQGILDGITLIRNMIETQPEDMVWTPELIKETCDAFISKYTSEDNGIAKIPDVPNLADEIPQEYTNAGMSSEAYTNLMSFLNEESDNQETSSNEQENPLLTPDVWEEVENFVEKAYNSELCMQGVDNYDENIMNRIAFSEIMEETIEQINCDGYKRVINDDASSAVSNTETLGEVHLDDESVIQLEDGAKVNLSDCFAEIIEQK